MPPKGWKPYRTHCPECGRSTAVTNNKKTGEKYLRAHRGNRPAGEKCPASNRTLFRPELH